MKDIKADLQEVLRRYQVLPVYGRIAVWGVAVVLALIMAGMHAGSEPAAVPGRREDIPGPAVSPGKEQEPYFLGEDVDKKAYVERLEAQYQAVAQKNEALALRVDELAQRMSELLRAQGRSAEILSVLERRMAEASAKVPPQDMAVDGRVPAFDPRAYQLEVINISPVKRRAAGTVYLPPGSFVRATLLTGVYAPAEASNPLPVLIRLDEAFYGPNASRIPLEGAFAIGRATGDLNSERALVQITTMASVLPTGNTFEHQGNIGYLTDTSGQLGIRGVVVRNTGGQMAMSFMTGFMGGASEALADAQTTAVVGENGNVARNVTGSKVRNATFQGLAQSAGQMSKYYEQQLEKIVPAVRVEAGVSVYFVVLEGAEVHGLKKTDISSVRFID